MNMQEIQKTIDVFYPDGGLVEVRSFSKQPLSGYFKDMENLVSCVSKYPNETFYFVLNEISDGCYGREQHEKIIPVGKKENTTGDKDITGRKWILVDADPKRTIGTSSTNEEKAQAKSTIGKVYNYLKNIGFQEPVVADSGNGYHLLYKVHIENTQDDTDTIKNFLLALDMMFADESVDIDTSVFNASRITKIYGVLAAKGANTKDRPHRHSRILRVPEAIMPTSIKLIQKVAAIVPQPAAPTYRNNYNNEKFDIESFISKHGIRVDRKGTWSNGTKYVLENCVFDPSHKSPDAAICVGNGGAIGYHCFHNSCQGRTWQDVRLMFEPNAYDREKEYQQTRTTKPQTGITREQLLQSKPIEPSNEESYPFKRMMDITPLDRSKLVIAKSGFTALDAAIIGHNKGELSIWSGGTGSGKSTILSQLALNNIQQGFKVALFSGELRNSRVKDWFMLQAAGRQYVMPSQYNNGYYVPRDIVSQIEEWCDDKIWVYDNDKGVSVDNVLDNFKRHIEKYQTDIVIIDNMMSLDMARVYGDKYEKQTALVLALSDMVKRYNVHVHFVCHPRKPTGFFRKADISGTADITNAADNVFMMHRVNNDFKRYAKDFLTEKVAKEYYEFTNVMEVMKNRDLGVEDKLIGFLYELESRRMLNERQENIIYGWNKKPYYESPTNNQQWIEIDNANNDLPFDI